MRRKNMNFNSILNRYCFYPKNYIFAASINQILQPCLTLQQELKRLLLTN